MKCILCNKDAGKYGHNPQPITEGKCCSKCNEKIVIPYRIREWLMRDKIKCNHIHKDEPENTICEDCFYAYSPIENANTPSQSMMKVTDGSKEDCAFCGKKIRKDIYPRAKFCCRSCRAKNWLLLRSHSPQKNSSSTENTPEDTLRSHTDESSGTKTQKGCGVSFFEGECRYICGKEGLCPYCKECEDNLKCVNCGFRKKAHGNLKEKGWCDNFRYCPYPYCEGDCPQCSSTNSPSKNDLKVKGGGNPPAGRKGCECERFDSYIITGDFIRTIHEPTCKKFKAQSPQESKVGLVTDGSTNLKDTPEGACNSSGVQNPESGDSKSTKGCGKEINLEDTFGQDMPINCGGEWNDVIWLCKECKKEVEQ